MRIWIFSLGISLASIFFLEAEAKEIKNIEFSQDGEVSRVIVTLDSPNVSSKKFHVVEDKQIILDLKDVSAAPSVLRPFDTSEFSGTVVLISPYRRGPNKEDVRIAVQLRDNARSLLQRDGSQLILTVENRFGAFNQYQMEKDEAPQEQVAQGQQRQGKKLNIPQSDSVEDILENLTLSGPKKYVGKRISLNVKDVPIAEILKMISDVSGFNIILDKEVLNVPNVTLNLTNIPWDQALDTILKVSKLVAEKNGNILMVTTLEKATEERELELQNMALAKEQQTLVTKIFPISFADLGEIQTIIEPYLTAERGSIATDERTNSLIVEDTVEAMERIRQIVDTLDKQTPQILIESKIVEVTESYSKEIGLSDGVNFGYDPVGQVGTGLAAVGEEAGGGERYAGPGFSFSSAPSAGGRNLLNLVVGRWSRLLDLNLTLQIMESENKGKIISSPRVITQNKKAASINSSETTSYEVQTSDLETGTITRDFEEVAATLDLQVTPQVTNEGSIAMEVNVSKTDISARPTPTSPPDTNSRTVTTNVLIDNGSTIVIGGIYRMSSTLSVSGVPLLKDLPLVGWLFRSSYNPQEQKSEMVVFLTPRIINQEEAGLVDRSTAIN